MILYLIKKIPFFRNYYFNHAGRKFVLKKLEHIIPHLRAGEKILDIGSGSGLISYVLREKQFHVIPLDIQEGNYHPSVKPVLYDGIKMPFDDKTFDTGLLLTILHHTTNQEEILTEAARLCKQVIVMEEIYNSRFQKYYTFFVDSFINLFYSPCPHTNRNDKEWKMLFESLNLKLEKSYSRNIFGVRQAVYILKPH